MIAPSSITSRSASGPRSQRASTSEASETFHDIVSFHALRTETVRAPYRTRRAAWYLMLGASLELGCWMLELFN